MDLPRLREHTEGIPVMRRLIAVLGLEAGMWIWKPLMGKGAWCVVHRFTVPEIIEMIKTNHGGNGNGLKPKPTIITPETFPPSLKSHLSGAEAIPIRYICMYNVYVLYYVLYCFHLLSLALYTGG